MCEDPRVEESTLTVADTPAVRQVLARWLASRRLTPRFAAAFASASLRARMARICAISSCWDSSIPSASSGSCSPSVAGA